MDLRLTNNIRKTLKRTSGASLIFVLFIMLFLMSIGVSTLAAAFANSGYIMRQSDYSRVRLLYESVHENIMHSLQVNPEDDDYLGYQIAMAIFKA
jgi:Tfp pilus assembly protein PilV